jgi:hypothetical protein
VREDFGTVLIVRGMSSVSGIRRSNATERKERISMFVGTIAILALEFGDLHDTQLDIAISGQLNVPRESYTQSEASS